MPVFPLGDDDKVVSAPTIDSAPGASLPSSAPVSSEPVASVPSTPVEPSAPDSAPVTSSPVTSIKVEPVINTTKNSVNFFQILIFPHLGPYPAPQQRETVTQKVILKAVKMCTKYEAVQNLNQEWVKSGGPLEKVSLITLQTSDADLQKPKYFECEAGFTVKREAGLDEYLYPEHVVARVKNQTVQLINLVDSEQYLKGVVPSEVYPTWPTEVLKTQAIAARTYALWSVNQARLKGIDGYDINDTIEYQAYSGLSKIRANTNQAVEDTQGLLIRSAEGEVIKAYFSADSGGYTADSIDVFKEPRSYCKAKPEIYDTAKYNSKWPKTVIETVAHLNQLFIQKRLIPVNTTLSSLSISTRDQSGRVTSLQATLTNGKSVKIGGVDFSSLLSLRSRLYELNLYTPVGAAPYYEIDGRGYGHGVGMSQQGSLQYHIQLGWKFDQILQFYYTGATVSQ